MSNHRFKSESLWYISLKGKQEGPFTLDDIQIKSKLGHFRAEAVAWRPGLKSWISLPEAVTQWDEEAINNGRETVEKQAPNVSASLKPNWKGRVEKKITRTRAENQFQAQSESRLFRSRAVMVPLLLLIFTLSAYEWTHQIRSEKIFDKLEALGPEQNALREVLTPSFFQVKAPNLALVLAGRDLTHPSFYVASRFKEAKNFSLEIAGKPSTLLNKVEFRALRTLKLPPGIAKIDLNLGKQETFVPGFYDAKIKDENEKVIYSQSFFLGGLNDQDYVSDLVSFHEALKQGRQARFFELLELLNTIDQQFTNAIQIFRDVGVKSPLTIKTVWKMFRKSSRSLQKQLLSGVAETFRRNEPDLPLYRTKYLEIETSINGLDQLMNKMETLAGSPEVSDKLEQEIAELQSKLMAQKGAIYQIPNQELFRD